MTNSENLANKNQYSVSEHTHDENEWEISVIAKDVAIKWQYYDAKNQETLYVNKSIVYFKNLFG